MSTNNLDSMSELDVSYILSVGEYPDLPTVELERIVEDISASAYQVCVASKLLHERKRREGFDADKVPVE